MTVPNTFGTATSAIPLSQLDANFNTPITLGNTAIQLGDTVTTLNNMTLANVTISSGNVTITNVAITTANVSGTANISTLVVVGNATVGGNTSVTGNSTVAGSVVLSGGTANGVAYLNTSKQLTTGSALVFDGTNLSVGTTALSGGKFSTIADLTLVNGLVIRDSATTYANNDNYLLLQNSTGTTAGGLTHPASGSLGVWGNDDIRFLQSAAATELMRLTSTSLYTASTINVGIGTSSPDGPLQVSFSNAQTGQFNAGASTLYLTNTNTTDNNWSQIYFTDSDGGAAAATFGAQYTNHANDYAELSFATRGASGLAERIRIDSSGNLIVGATSAYDASYRGIQAINTTGGDCAVFTTTGFSGTVVRWNKATSGDNQFIDFFTETSITPRGSITYNRTAGLVAYNQTSDYRAKDISGPITNSGALIDSVPVYMGKMKDATQERPMFIAHETPAYAHTGEKDAVDADGKPVYQQMDASALIPVMWAEIQSLRKRLAAAGI